MKRGELLKSFRIRKVTTVSKNGTIKSKSKKNSPPIQRRNFGSFARYAHRVEDLGEEVRKEVNRKKILKIDQTVKTLQPTIKKLEAKQVSNDDKDKINSSNYD